MSVIAYQVLVYITKHEVIKVHMIHMIFMKINKSGVYILPM